MSSNFSARIAIRCSIVGILLGSVKRAFADFESSTTIISTLTTAIRSEVSNEENWTSEFPALYPNSVDWAKNGDAEIRSAGYNNVSNMTEPCSSIEAAGFDFIDRWFSSQTTHVIPVSEYVVSVLYAPPNSGLPSTYSVSAREAFLNKPLYCDLVLFTGHDHDDEQWKAYDLFRVSYAKQAPGVCLFNIHSKVSSQELDKAFGGSERKKWRFHLMERYRAALIVNELTAQGRIISYNHGYPTLLYVDADAFPTNLFYTIDDLWDRLRLGLRRPTTERRLCDTSPSTVICHGADANPSTVAQIGFAVAIEAHCHREYAVNSGVWLMRPSRLVTAIMGAAILAFEADVKHQFDDGDQGFMNYILTQLFGYDYLFFQSLCNPFRWDYIAPSIDPNISEIHVARIFKYRAAKSHPIFGRFISELLGDEGLLLAEPHVAVWTSPRWFNAYGCPWFLSDPTRYVEGWHPGDFIVHFASCNHIGEKGYFWRKQVYTYARNILPIPDYERDWDRWLATSETFWHIWYPHETLLNPLNLSVAPFEETPEDSIVMPARH